MIKYFQAFFFSVIAIIASFQFLEMTRSHDNVIDQDGEFVYLPLILDKFSSGGWPTVGANNERTSWVPEEVKGFLKPVWYKKFEPYISSKIQVIASNNMLYISTSAGLYSLDAVTGDEKWIYPTELPLGHSPTIQNGVAYVGGFDHKLHAIDAFTGLGLWTFDAEKGFETNPLVVDGMVYLGNRDGYMYAVYANEHTNRGQLAWKFKTNGPILFSAAYKDGIIYFASNDSYAYALNAKDGTLIWKSVKLPGAGFHSWWPVVYRDVIIFTGSENYRGVVGPYGIDEQMMQLNDLFPNNDQDPRGVLSGPTGHEPGDWTSGTLTMDTSKPNKTANGFTTAITEYLEAKPWRRTYFVLDRFTGVEKTYDFDHDGKSEYAPILFLGSHSGNRYPPVLGKDGVIYQLSTYMSDPYISGGGIVGWKLNTPYLSLISSYWNPTDEENSISAGGNLIYWDHAYLDAGSKDISSPLLDEWVRYYVHLDTILPGYNSRAWYDQLFGNQNGVYGYLGDQNPPIPYLGKLYFHQRNALVAFGETTQPPVEMPIAKIKPIQSAMTTPTTDQLKQDLSLEIEKIVQAGFLRPGYIGSGLFDHASLNFGDYLADYWSNPADTIYTLIRALPYLPTDLQQRTRVYIQNYFMAFPLYSIAHIGWKDGVAREAFDLPPEVDADRINYPPQTSTRYEQYSGWKFPPYSFYAMWKYAVEFGNANEIYQLSLGKLNSVPDNTYLSNYPYVHNAYIAGYLGFLELEKLAGYPESSTVRAELNRLLELRSLNFNKDTPWVDPNDPYQSYKRELSVARNFMYLVPELAQYLHDHNLVYVQNAIAEYEFVAPYWFVSKFESTPDEGVLKPLYTYHALFQAKAQILGENRSDLIKYLDVPAVQRGDLFYLQNLIAVIEAGSP